MPETAKRTARVPILGEDGRISDDYIPAAIGEGVESAEAAATRAESAKEVAETAKTAAQSAKTAAETAQKGAESAKTDAEAAKTAAEKAKADAADSATGAASSATQAANAAAEAAGAAAEAARGNVLKGTIGPAPLPSADDAYATKPRGLTVYGNTRQNLWVNPSGTKTQNGITVTPNSDGGITVSGTSTSSNLIDLTVSYALRPGSTYVFDVDQPLSTESGAGGFYIQSKKADGSRTTIAYPSGTTVSPVVFTVPVDTVLCYFGIQVLSGSTVSGTYRVMLNEGSEAEPWCPPGLNVVDELSLVTAGKNLFTPNGNTQIQGNGGSNQTIGIGAKVSGIPVQQVVTFSLEYRLSSGAGTIAVQQNVQPWKSLGIYGLVLVGDRQWHKVSGNVTVNDAFNKVDNIDIRLDNVTGLLEIRNLQLEFGPTATAYEPPAVTTTPIDLQGHTLHSLPDGTRDELRIDGTGAVTLVQRVGVATAPTEAGSWSWGTAGDGIASFTLPAKSTGTQTDMTELMRCDKLPIRQKSGESSYAMVGTTQGHAKNPVITSTATAATVAGGATYLYPLAAPQEVDLTAVTLPALPAPTVNVWADAESSGTGYAMAPDVGMEYERDVTIAFEKLQAQVSALNIMEATNG